MKEEVNKKKKPKQYTHIDYEALIIYAMKNRVSIEVALMQNGLNIARSTVKRNINKIKKEKESRIINLYEQEYIPNMQKEELPEKLQQKIDEIPLKKVVIKPEWEDLYKKLSFMKELVDICDGNVAEATRIINSGNTILGNVKISRQGLGKNIKRYEKIAEEVQKEKKKIEGREK